MTSSEALRLYGVLTGMALPCILFPSALTTSIGTVLMPAVSAAQASDDNRRIIRLLKQSVGSCFILGLGCCLFFLIFGNFLGRVLFHSSAAGSFILTLSWICPFLYTNTALTSIINGLGKTFCTLLVNTAGLLVRIAGVFFCNPQVWNIRLSDRTFNQSVSCFRNRRYYFIFSSPKRSKRSIDYVRST